MFKINTDKFGFAREPQPDKVSRDYAAELVRKLIADEKAAREANDNILDGYISQEADIRGTEDARIQALIGDINAVLNSHGGSIAGLLEQAQAEAQARESKDDALQALINALQAAFDKEIEDRTSKDTELDTRITAEASAREAKDAELQAAIEAETQARIDEDASLHGSIDATNINMEMGDRELQANIDKKQDKVTISEYPEDNSELIYDLSIMHNQELRTKSTLANGITFVIPDSVYPDDYVTSLSFSTGGTAPQIGYTATGIINWVGTDCSVSEGKSIFAPKANTRYDIVIYFNGVQFVGLVNGFIPATINNSGQTEATS